MQVILLHDVDRLGHEGDVVTVADGYARNYLLPQSLAVKADRGTLKDLETRRHAIARRDTDKRSAAEAAAAEINSKTVVVKATTGQGTKLHGTVTTTQIAEAAVQQVGLQLDRRDIDIPEPIREVGRYLVSVRLYKDIHAQLPVEVVSAHGIVADEDADWPERVELVTEEAPAAEAEVAPEATDEAESDEPAAE